MYPILEVKNLTKRFGSFTAVNDISFHMNEGKILGLLGPNGAGKTTTIQMLLGVLQPTAGEIRYFNKSLAKYRSEIMENVNFSSTYVNLPWNLTVWENMYFISHLYNIKNRKERINKIMDIFQLHELKNKLTASLSAGQQTRVSIAKAFVNFPKVLLLDEPTASLDVEIADDVRKFLLNQRKEFNTSIVITSHNMAEVEELCDRVIFIHEGKIIADDTPLQLAKTIETAHVELAITKNLEELFAYCRKNNLVIKTKGKHVVIDVKEKNIPRLLRDIVERKFVYNEISIEKPTLEDYFFEVVGKQI